MIKSVTIFQIYEYIIIIFLIPLLVDPGSEVTSLGLGGMGHFGPQFPQFPFPPTCCPESSINVEHHAPFDESPSQLHSL